METGFVNSNLVVIFFLYGLAFFSMGLAIVLEGGRGSDVRLKLALRPLAAFGIIHGLHEWLEMFALTDVITPMGDEGLVWKGILLAVLAFSFLSLSGFGFSLLAPNLRMRRLSLLAPLTQAAIWGFGLLIFRNRFSVDAGLWNVADVWTRYILGLPSALAASVGLIVQQRAFRRVGMAKFGRDSLIASVAFGWYGLVGQIFVRPSRLPPSTYLNDELFLFWFGFPVQIIRAAAAIVVAIYVIRFLRAFDTEIKHQIATLQTVRLEDAERREALRGELFRRVVAAQEAERQRIARELHDETGQKLTAIGLGLQGIGSSLRKDLDLAEKNLHELQNLTDISLVELQRLIADLRPSHLDDLGLPAALRWYIKEIKRRTELKIKFNLRGDERDLSASVNIALFRVTQEALTNVVKHAEANKVSVKLRYRRERVSVCIEDDGKGFDVQKVERLNRQSWGLLGMRERTSLLDGQFTLNSKPGEGAKVEVSIPYQQEEIDYVMEEPNGDKVIIS